MTDTDREREQKLQALAAENARLAEVQQNLIETIRENKRQLEWLPEIIRRLNEQLKAATAEMNRTGAEHDALEAEVVADDQFRTWADGMADDYSDWQLTTQPPRPNPFGLFREPG